MQRFDLQPDLTDVIRTLERRIETLERAPKATTPGTSLQLPSYRVADLYTVVTSGTFAAIHEIPFIGPIPYSCFGMAAVYQSDVGTTGEYRIRVFTSESNGDGVSDLTTAPFPIADGANTNFAIEVDMSEIWSLGVGAIITMQLEARRVSGAGNLYIYRPVTDLAGPESFGVVPTPIADLL